MERGFSKTAALYERRRPDYPSQVADRLIALAPVAGVVVDVGAGTGKLTRHLVGRGRRVIAVEPVSAMRTEFRGTCPDAEILDGAAESLPVCSSSVDVVVAAQAFHWFDPGRALDEFARVLRPGGFVSLVWNQIAVEHRSLKWWREVERLSRQYVREWPRRAQQPLAEVFASKKTWSRLEQHKMYHSQVLTVDEFAELMCSSSFVGALTEPEGQAVHSAFGKLGERWEKESGEIVVNWRVDHYTSQLIADDRRPTC